jgi:hypothetical protein
MRRKQRNLDTAGGRAAAEIEDNLEKLRRPQRDTAKLELAFRKAYDRLWAADLIQGDPAARALMLRIASARNVGQLERQVSALARRVAELDVKRRAKSGNSSNRPKSSTPRVLESRDDPYAESAPRRTFIAL